MKLLDVIDSPDQQPAPTQGKTKLSDVWDSIKKRDLSVQEAPRVDTLTGTEREGAPQSKQSPLAELWEGLKSVSPKAAAADLGRGAAEIPGQAAQLAGNLAKGLMPTQAGARAGGEAVRQLGDVGAFASGGLTGPLQVPQQAAGLARGLDVQPRIAQVPRPQLALPPPRMGVSGAPAMPAGPGYPAPPRQPGTMRMGDPIPFTPTPPSGIIPAGPGSTMTAPSATPVGIPKPTGAPLVPTGTEMGQPSQLASSLVGHDPSPIDRTLVSRYRRTFSPGMPGMPGGKGLAQQDQRIVSAVDSIIDAKDQLRFKTPKGEELPAGRLPRNLDEFVQGIDQLKGQVFDQYDTMAKRISGQGVRVPLAPAVAKLQELAAQPAVRDLHPALAQRADSLAQDWTKAQSYSPKEAQNVIQHLNAQLQNLDRNPTSETFSHNTMMNQVRDTLRDTLNQTMNTALQGPQYAGLRAQYGSLTSIEGDVTNAFRKEMAKQPGLAHKIGDIGFLYGLMHGTVTLNPKMLGSVAAARAGQALVEQLRSPNRAVSRMFSARASDLQPTTFEQLSAKLGTGLGQGRQRQFDASLSAPYVSSGGP